METRACVCVCVCVCVSQMTSPRAGGIEVPALEACKMVGDPNVPSGELSFVIDLTRYKTGRWVV